MALWMFTRREIKSRPGRAILTLLSIVIGVAALVSVTTAITATRRAYTEMFDAVSGRAALEVTVEGGGGFDESVVEQLEKVAGVKAAVPVVQRVAPLYLNRERRLRIIVVGVDPEKDEAARDYTLDAGHYFTAADEELGTDDEPIYPILMERGFADSIKAKVDDDFKVTTQQGIETVRVIGILKRSTAAALEGGAIFMPIWDAKDLFVKKEGTIDSVHLVLTEKANEEKVLADVRAALPAGLVVQPPKARGALAKETTISTEQGMAVATALSLLIAVFVILNTFLMNVSERRRQLGILRAIGTTRSQVINQMLKEGLLMGVVGTAIGCAVGVGGAFALTRIMEQVYEMTLPTVRLTPWPFILAGLIGPGVALIATYIPARKAGYISPLEGMRGAVAEDIEPVPTWMKTCGFVTMFVAGAVMMFAIFGYLPLDVATTAACFVLVGVILLIPSVLRPLSKGVSKLLSPLLGVLGDLGHHQLLRRRTRTSLTIGVLMVAIAIEIGLGNTVINNVADVHTWFDHVISGDFFIRGTMPDPGTGLASEIPPEIVPKVKALPGVKTVDPVHYFNAHVGEQSVVVISRDFSLEKTLPLQVMSGDPQQVHQELLEGEVAIGTGLAQRIKLEKGDEFELKTNQKSYKLKVAGTVNEYTVGGMAIYMDHSTSVKLLGVEEISALVIRAEPGEFARAESALVALCDETGMMLQSQADLNRMLDKKVEAVVGGLWVLMALGFVVAALGIVNTLTMNVIEQTREIGLLRVVAMTRRQVRRTILSQAAIMGILGLTPGAIAGLVIGYITNIASHYLTGHQINFVIHGWLILGCYLGALLVVLIAAWVPAQRAARLHLATALQYE